jgi:hypothetical protein
VFKQVISFLKIKLTLVVDGENFSKAKSKEKKTVIFTNPSKLGSIAWLWVI